jgi:hypothetical protein
LKFYNANIFLKGLGLQLDKVVWITTSDSVENAYLLHSDVILQIQARWITKILGQTLIFKISDSAQRATHDKSKIYLTDCLRMLRLRWRCVPKNPKQSKHRQDRTDPPTSRQQSPNHGPNQPPITSQSVNIK